MPKPLNHFENLSRSPLGNHLRSAMAKAGNVPRPGRHPLTIFETRQLLAWITSYLKHLGPRHDFLSASSAPNGTSVYAVPNDLRLSLAADWGTGTDEAWCVADQMMKWDGGAAPHITIHLGDTYYVGDEQEVRENFLGGIIEWPAGSLGKLAMNGNHEMYTGGDAYFRIMLPEMGIPPRDSQQGRKGQGCSFFCLENAYWRVIGLDTGYNSVGWPIIEHLPGIGPKCPLPDKLLDWLRKTVRPGRDDKGTVLLSHHQIFSAFPDQHPTTYPKPAIQLAEFLSGKTVLWLWGHEHRFSGYKQQPNPEGKQFALHGRCIGHGGMPVELCDPMSEKKNPYVSQLLFYDARLNPLYPVLPPAHWWQSKSPKLGLNGYSEVEFSNDTLTIRYKSLVPRTSPTAQDRYEAAPQLLLTEKFQRDTNGNVRLISFQPQSADDFKTP